MKVKALQNILYSGEIYNAGSVFEMDECTAAISAKYNKIEIIGGGEVEIDEGEIVEGIPPLKKKK